MSGKPGWPGIKHAAANVCIYCGDTTGPLSDEHIVAACLGGHWVLPEASCGKCADVTSALELRVARGFLRPIRKDLGLRSRKNNLPDVIPARSLKGESVSVPFDRRPLSLALPNLRPPRILYDSEGATEPLEWVYCVKRPEKLQSFPTGGMREDVDWGSFCRVLAKSAHADVFKYVRDDPQVRYLLRDYILYDNPPDYLHIGGTGLRHSEFRKTNGLHEMNLSLRTHCHRRFLVSYLRLFANLGAPPFLVVVAEVMPDYCFVNKSG